MNVSPSAIFRSGPGVPAVPVTLLIFRCHVSTPHGVPGVRHAVNRNFVTDCRKCSGPITARTLDAPVRPASQFKEFKYLDNDAECAPDIRLPFVQMYKFLRQ